MNNPFNYFDVIYYINLDKRTDRKKSILNELQKMDINMKRVKRIPGIIDKFGALGCSKSHLLCLMDCKKNNYNNCLILEDDFIFKHNKKKTFDILNNFLNGNISWDLLMFSSFVRKWEHTQYPFLIKIHEGQTTSGYCVNNNFLNKLINNFTESIKQLEKHNLPICKFCLDQYWKRLQKNSKWYILNPRIGYQKEDYSDIEKKIVNYKDKHDFPMKTIN